MMRYTKTGWAIEKYRKRKGLTQAQLAYEVHVSRTSIADYERGKTEPSLKVLRRIMQVLQIPVADLV